jgi:hypothetical protein
MKTALLFALVTCVSAAGTFFGVTAMREDATAIPIIAAAMADPTPTAAEFGRALAGTANQFGGAKVLHPHCVEAAPGRYMCAYVLSTGGQEECHIMQGRWTPDLASTITVTLAGRAENCDTLRAAINSLD